MSEYVIPTTRVYETPREPRDRLHRLLLPMLALSALVGPMLLVVAVIVWALFRASPVAENPAVEAEICQRAVTCCEALEGEQAEACRPMTELAGTTSGIPQSDDWVQSSSVARCQMELRQMHATAVARGESIPACAPTPQ